MAVFSSTFPLLGPLSGPCAAIRSATRGGDVSVDRVRNQDGRTSASRGIARDVGGLAASLAGATGRHLGVAITGERWSYA